MAWPCSAPPCKRKPQGVLASFLTIWAFSTSICAISHEVINSAREISGSTCGGRTYVWRLWIVSAQYMHGLPAVRFPVDGSARISSPLFLLVWLYFRSPCTLTQLFCLYDVVSRTPRLKIPTPFDTAIYGGQALCTLFPRPISSLLKLAKYTWARALRQADLDPRLAIGRGRDLDQSRAVDLGRSGEELRPWTQIYLAWAAWFPDVCAALPSPLVAALSSPGCASHHH